jgi:SAM-dependent methyltransferase
MAGDLMPSHSKAAAGEWYDYPQYYDLAFAEETPLEADFIEAACRKYALGPVRRLLEPGCGGGRLVVELAKRGFELTAFDTSEASLKFLRSRLRRCRRSADVFHADMTAFGIPQPVDAAFNTYNTFRHLLSEEAARSHLESVAAAVRPGGIYILGLHLLPMDASEECTERWRATRGEERVTFTLRVIATNRRKRIERLRVNMLVRSPQRELRLANEFDFRMYTAAQLRRLLRSVPAWELCSVHDFCYEIDQTLPLDDELSDTVLILRRR